jgi:hypothetical protein
MNFYVVYFSVQFCCGIPVTRLLPRRSAASGILPVSQVDHPVDAKTADLVPKSKAFEAYCSEERQLRATA